MWGGERLTFYLIITNNRPRCGVSLSGLLPSLVGKIWYYTGSITLYKKTWRKCGVKIDVVRALKVVYWLEILKKQQKKPSRLCFHSFLNHSPLPTFTFGVRLTVLCNIFQWLEQAVSCLDWNRAGSEWTLQFQVRPNRGECRGMQKLTSRGAIMNSKTLECLLVFLQPKRWNPSPSTVSTYFALLPCIDISHD